MLAALEREKSSKGELARQYQDYKETTEMLSAAATETIQVCHRQVAIMYCRGVGYKIRQRYKFGQFQQVSPISDFQCETERETFN